MRISDWSSDVCSSDLSCSDTTERPAMKKNPDNTLLLVLSEKEAAIVRNIVETPLAEPGGRTRLILVLAVAVLLAGCLAVGLSHPELVRAIEIGRAHV